MVAFKIATELEEVLGWVEKLPEGTELRVSVIKEGYIYGDGYYKDGLKVKNLIAESLSGLDISELGNGEDWLRIEGTCPHREDALCLETTRITLSVSKHSYFSDLVDGWVERQRDNRFNFGSEYFICSGAEQLLDYIAEVAEDLRDHNEVLEITKAEELEDGGFFVSTSDGSSWRLEPLALEDDPSLDKHGNFCGLAGMDDPCLVAADGWEVVSEWGFDEDKELDTAIEELLEPYDLDADDWLPAYYSGCDPYESFIKEHPQFAEVSSLLGQYPYDEQYSFALFVKKDSVEAFKTAYLDWVKREISSEEEEE